MAKIEPYNFSTHLKAIVRPVLKQKGFTVKGTKFVRNQNSQKEEVHFQRSSWNLPADCGVPSEFYLNVILGHNPPTLWGRIDRPSRIPEPIQWIRQRELPREESIRFYDTLSASQKEEIGLYHDSTRWLYQSEDELVTLLNEAVSVLEPHVNQNFEKLNELPTHMKLPPQPKGP